MDKAQVLQNDQYFLNKHDQWGLFCYIENTVSQNLQKYIAIRMHFTFLWYICGKWYIYMFYEIKHLTFYLYPHCLLMNKIIKSCEKTLYLTII